MKTAVITGASSGMGREFAKEICRRYVNIESVWLIARRQEKLQELKDEIAGKNEIDTKNKVNIENEGNTKNKICGKNAINEKNKTREKEIVILSLDLTKDEDLEQYKKELEQRNPEVCMLINCAGYGKIGSFEEVGYEHNRGMVKLNCQALTDVTYLTIPYIRSRGQIIQLASSAAFVPQPDFAVYAASKSYVLSLSRALRCELSDREISVTSVCPGPVKTEFFDVAQEGTDRKIKRIKMLAMAKPDKVVKKALKDAHKGKEKSVYGILMGLFEILCKVVPHKILLAFMS